MKAINLVEMHKKKLFLRCIVVLAFLIECVKSRVVGGYLASIQDYPYQLCIIIKKSEGVPTVHFIAGAVVVSQYWAFTAAHCLKKIHNKLIDAGMVYLRGNSTIWNDHGYHRDHEISLTKIHPKYVPRTEDQDIDFDFALVKVIQAFGSINERPINVAGKYYEYTNHADVTVSGWGSTLIEPKPVDHLRAVEVQLVCRKECHEIYYNRKRETVSETMICAWAKDKDACGGDSGGPLVENNVLIGLVSWGANCASVMYPGVYTRVSKFNEWIRQYERENDELLGITFVNE